MGILPDWKIAALCSREKPMITPFVPQTVREKNGRRVVSYGVSSFGYDARVAGEFKVFCDTHCAIMDPKQVDPKAFVDVQIDDGKALTIPAHGYVLGHTIETFDIPRDIAVTCLGKSTYARSGLLVNVTPLEPEWRGQVTLEFANLLPIPTKVWVGEGICQFLFFRGEHECRISYADKGGKYQDQRGVVTART